MPANRTASSLDKVLIPAAKRRCHLTYAKLPSYGKRLGTHLCFSRTVLTSLFNVYVCTPVPQRRGNSSLSNGVHQGMNALGIIDMEFQNMLLSGTKVLRCLLWLRFMLGNLIRSRKKKTGRSLKTKSWLPSWVKNLSDQPRTSRTVSLDPFSPTTVEMRVNTFVSVPTPLRNLASVRSETSSRTSKVPQGPAALA